MIERKFLIFMPENTVFILYGVAVFVLVLFIYGVRYTLDILDVSFKALLISIGGKLKEKPRDVFRHFISYILLQSKIREKTYSSLLHIPIFLGFLLLLLGTTVIFIDEDILSQLSSFKLLKGQFYIAFEFVLDFAGLLFFFGLLLALYRRTIQIPANIHSEPMDFVLIALLLFIVFTGFLIESLRLKLDAPPYSQFSFAGYVISTILFDNSKLIPDRTAYIFTWYMHFIAVMIFIAMIPFTKLKHIFLIPLNLILSPPKDINEKAKLSTPFNIFELEDEQDNDADVFDSIGIGSVIDFKWDEKLQIYSCTNCGRCEEVCPAHSSGRILSPRHVVQKLVHCFPDEDRKEKLFKETLEQEEIWGCTNCYACIEVCPSFIRHVDHFLNFRRFILIDAFEDDQKIGILEKIERNGNPYGLPSYSRVEWLEEQDVRIISDTDDFEYFYFIGCSSSYDQRCKGITDSLIKILNAAQINFAILGEEERCCGEPAKRMGEEGLFQMTAVQNIELFQAYNADKILVHCPHCFNMLKHEYRDFNAKFEVIHYSELILNLIRHDRIHVNTEESVRHFTFHDPCNLGRLNGMYDSPRNILSTFGNFKEMNRCKDGSFCCGGGGGNSFYSVKEEKRISLIRLEEAIEIDIDTVSVSCPFCLTMFEDAKGNFLKDRKAPNIYDIAEIVSMRLK
jgi:Fe-S oxidoreductase/nitrate reductase gamma subunit